MSRTPRCRRMNSDGLTCDYDAPSRMHSECATTRGAFCGTDNCHQFVGDQSSIAVSPAVPSSGMLEPPVPAHGPNGEPTDAQANVGSPKYHAILTVTATWMGQGKPSKRVLRFHADESECGDLLTLLFDIERAINNSVDTTYALRAHASAEQS